MEVKILTILLKRENCTIFYEIIIQILDKLLSNSLQQFIKKNEKTATNVEEYVKKGEFSGIAGGDIKECILENILEIS